MVGAMGCRVGAHWWGLDVRVVAAHVGVTRLGL